MIRLPPPTPHLLLLANGLDIGHSVGGAEVFCAELCLALAQQPWRCTLGLLAWQGGAVEQAWKERLTQAGIRVVHPPAGQKRSLGFSLRQLWGVCRSEQVVLVHSHCQLGSLIAAALRQSGQVKAALRTVHIDQEWGTGPLAWGLRQIFSKGLFGLALDAQACVSRGMAARLSRSLGARLGGRLVLTIPNAIPDLWFAGQKPTRPAPQAGPRPPTLGMVGALIARKGHAWLIEALAQLAAELPEVRLWLVGEGPERGRLEALARQLQVERQVLFLGQRADVAELLPQLDVFVLPSFVEGLPTVILESMASGTPVVASDIAGNRELIEDGLTGWLVPVGSATALAETLRRVLAAPQARRQVAEAAAQQAQAFRISTVAQQYAGLYAQLLRRA